jgi:transcriptional regulator with XRE-family HTH domain
MRNNEAVPASIRSADYRLVFARSLQAAREDAGLETHELARRSGVLPSYIQGLEKGRSKFVRSKILDIGRSLPSSSPLAKAIAQWKDTEPLPRLDFDPACGTGGFLLSAVAELMREARESKGLSIRGLARLSGLDATYLSRIERREVNAPSLANIAIIASQLPGSELARQVRAVEGAHELKETVLKLESDLERLIISLPPKAFEDSVWVATIKSRLAKCVRVIAASERYDRATA